VSIDKCTSVGSWRDSVLSSVPIIFLLQDDEIKKD
jgi:hypothetical protein